MQKFVFNNLYHHSSLKSSYDCQRIMSELCIFCNLYVSGRRHVVVCNVFGRKQHRLCGDTGILFIYFYLHVSLYYLFIYFEVIIFVALSCCVLFL